MILQSRLSGEHVGVDLIHRWSTAFSKQANEIRPAAVDLSQADGQSMTFGLLFIGDALAKVDIAPDDSTLLAQFAQLREDLLDQFLAHGMHVAEGRGNEYTELAAPWRSSTVKLRTCTVRAHSDLQVLFQNATPCE